MTLLAVIVALFKEDLVKHWRRPRLTAKVKLEAPDCHKVPQVIVDRSSGRPMVQRDAFYFRLWVQNEGTVRADQVQVFASELRRRNANGSFQRVDSHLPMNLKWAHTGDVFTAGISSGMGMHCDIGHIADPNQRIPGEPGGIRFELETEVLPTSRGHEFEPGVYRLVLKIAAANSPPLDRTYEINFTGDWFADERDMFSKGISIVELAL